MGNGFLEFLLGIGRANNVSPYVTISTYFDLFVNVTLGIGLVFELPILIFFLTRLGVVSEGWLLRKFKYAVLVAFIVAAIITPTPDVATQTVFAVPMLALYLLGIAMSWMFRKRKPKES